ncbi:DUF1848 family protein [Pelomyxa schiedti]|nr:DUF1848 family protein [Pelomyxa schiedti]
MSHKWNMNDYFSNSSTTNSSGGGGGGRGSSCGGRGGGKGKLTPIPGLVAKQNQQQANASTSGSGSGSASATATATATTPATATGSTAETTCTSGSATTSTTTSSTCACNTAAIPMSDVQVISCSRRTDVPAFYMKWLCERLREGFADVEHGATVTRINLSPAVVRSFVWWSKDYAPWIDCYNDPTTGPLLKQYDAHCFNFTVNSPSELEPGIRHTLEQRLEQLAKLVSFYGPESIILRFDPIVLYRKKGDSTRYDNLSHYPQICAAAGALGIKFIVFAFCIPYKTVVPRMASLGFELIAPSIVEKKHIISSMAEIAGSHGISLRTCCGPDLIGFAGITKSSCVNGDQVSDVLKLRGKAPLTTELKDPHQRTECGCTKSTDIGSYALEFACGHKCLYCYANPLNRNSQADLF